MTTLLDGVGCQLWHPQAPPRVNKPSKKHHERQARKRGSPRGMAKDNPIHLPGHHVRGKDGAATIYNAVPLLTSRASSPGGGWSR